MQPPGRAVPSPEVKAGFAPRLPADQDELSPSEAEDVVQETTKAVALAIGRFRYEPEQCRLRTWLNGIMKRQVANQFRRRLGKGRLVEPLPGSDANGSVIEDLPDPASARPRDRLWDEEWEQIMLYEVAHQRIKAVCPRIDADRRGVPG
jgi:DNA-directed RNA polymerase specialized sigma24 family protein